MTTITLPQLGEGVEEATVSFWHFKTNDKITKGQDIVEMATDKATFNVPATVSGHIIQILAEEGQTVKVGDGLVVIQEDVDS